MSFTEIYAFDLNGFPYIFAQVHNSWRGAFAVWHIMEDRYLPMFVPRYIMDTNWYRPDMTVEDIKRNIGYQPSRLIGFGNIEDHSHEIWDLVDDLNIPDYERIVLYTTFDKCLVRKENLATVVAAFRQFDGDTSLKEQADILEKAAGDPNIIAIGWNQTSVNGDTWINFGGYDEDEKEYIPYNCLTGKDHFWIFDEFKSGNKKGETN